MYEQTCLNENTYNSSCTYLTTVLEHMLEAGRSVRELSEFALERFGADFLPYLRQYLHDVAHGRVSVKGLNRTAREALAENSVSREQRECMIREAAYLRAEARGFCGGSPEQDWIDAEQEIDLRLAQGPGLIVPGGRALSTVISTMERELAEGRQAVSGWLGDGTGARPQAAKEKPAARRQRTTARAGAASAGAEVSAVKRAVPARRTATTKPVASSGKAASSGKGATGVKAVTKEKAGTKEKASAKKATGRTTARKAAGARGASTVEAPAAPKGKSVAKKRSAAAKTPRKKTAAKKRAATTSTAKSRRGARRT